MQGTLAVTGDEAADHLVNTNPLALLLAMMLDQQLPMEVAFNGPAILRRRLGHLAAKKIAAMPQDEFVAVCCERPAIHRFPAVMARRIHGLCDVLTAQYHGRGEQVWTGVESGSVLWERLLALPGFGEEKAQILVAVLGKRFGVQPDGWRDAAGKFGDDVPRSVADVWSPETLAEVRAWKRAQKAANLDKQDRPLKPRSRQPDDPL